MCPKGYHSHIHANLPCPNITVCLPVMGELKCTGLTFFLPTMKLFLAFFTYCCYMELHGKNNKNKIYASSIMVNISEKSVRITIYNSIKPCNIPIQFLIKLPANWWGNIFHLLAKSNFYLHSALGECSFWTRLPHTYGLLGRRKKPKSCLTTFQSCE